MPCLMALRRELFLPAVVFGPVDRWALRRFAASFRSEICLPALLFSAAPAVSASDATAGWLWLVSLGLVAPEIDGWVSCSG